MFLMVTMTACNSFVAGQISLSADKMNYETVSSSVVRIHIRANSNSESDQSVKLKVRDNITAFLETALENCRSKKQSLDTIAQNRGKLEKIANNTLYQHGFNYKSAVFVRSEVFPEKSYDGYIFPQGVYDALIIELGTGTGDNWWCVAFPPLCFVPEGDGEGVQYKSWVKELLDKIFD